MLRVVLSLCLAACLSAAPANIHKRPASANTHVKRSIETIQYQPNNNKPLSTGKKSLGTDGVAPPDNTLTEKLDKKATMTAETNSVSTKPDAVSAGENQESGKTNTDDEIKDLTHMVLNSEYSKDKSDAGGMAAAPPLNPQPDWTAMDAAAASQEMPEREQMTKQGQKKKNGGVLSFHDYFYPLFSNNQRRKRTARAYTAEGMTSQTTSGELQQHRAKRGIRLSPEDLRLLENYLETDDLGYNTDAESLPVADAYDGYPYVKRSGGDSGESLPSEDSSAAVREEQEIRNELELMKYLTADRADEAAADVYDAYPKRAYDASLSDAGIEAIVYHGRQGIFIPTDGVVEDESPQKRQYMSFVPGVKRNPGNAFYPYAYEPAAGSKWGALVPGEKREVGYDDYERLYKLASALRGQDVTSRSQEEWLED